MRQFISANDQAGSLMDQIQEARLFQLLSQLQLALSDPEKWQHFVTYGQVKSAYTLFLEVAPESVKPNAART